MKSTIYSIKLRPLLQIRPPVEFHISRSAREVYSLQQSLFSKEGHLVTADYQAIRELAERVNLRRDVKKFPRLRVSAAEIFALGLMHEIFHHVIDVYLEENGPEILEEALQHLFAQRERKGIEKTLLSFVEQFPPRRVYTGEIPADTYLFDPEEGSGNTVSSLEEMFLLWATNQNTAISTYKELVDDSHLASVTSYQELMEELYLYFEKLPGLGEGSLNLIDFLRAPAREAPNSIIDQLSYIVENWQRYIAPYSHLLLRGLDFLREEKRPVFPPGPGPVREIQYQGLDLEYEGFSKDTDWMPRVVLLAKSTLVWLDQLTRSYGRTIQRLDQVPDEELDLLAERGFNALWLIGLWERSRASKTIKRSCGNPEAEASAYSLKRYAIADELGGWEALHDLSRRCEQRGIRLASDMVPNHTGIDGDWVYEHPEWYLQLSSPPYPSYTYQSQDLSDNPDFSLHIEDHYYDQTDAALTFKRYDHRSGDTRFIYHGNDGTSTPWNDTAQLDFLNPDTREAIIRTIIQVARTFPIIRFDAAMTLARKHIHRLWYPAPGSGGDIPGRSEHGMSQEEFERRMPKEFWREVVDRVAEEAPDTLLLAEAFWMMEGFFVRTLGMHRVYNSAFMNMLKNEENEKYRNTIKNTIAFDPEILKRFVNFMSNPDEETAIDQFGNGDKYFGVCTLMVTMPGLPMFGHGQIEGYHEKYGMEYRRAYWDEQPDRYLVNEHYHRIFPLMKKRYLFSKSENFRLFDLYRENGEIDSNTFIFTNRYQNEAALVAYNNAYTSINGWIRNSAPFALKEPDGRKSSREFSLAESLGIDPGREQFTIFREQSSGLWYIRKNTILHQRGMFIQLDGYESQVYLDFYQVSDTDGLYRRLFEDLNGRGVRDIEKQKKRILLQPIHRAFSRFLQGPLITPIKQALLQGGGVQQVSFEDYWSYYDDFLDECILLGYGTERRKQSAFNRFQKNLEVIKRLSLLSSPTIRPYPADQAGYYYRGLSIMPEAPLVLLAWLVIAPLNDFCRDDERYTCAADMAEDLMLPQQFAPLLSAAHVPEELHPHIYDLMFTVSTHSRWNVHPETESASGKSLLESLIREDYTARFLQLHADNGIEWYHGESMQEFIWWLNTLAILNQVETGQGIAESDGVFSLIAGWIQAEEEAEYRVRELLQY